MSALAREDRSIARIEASARAHDIAASLEAGGAFITTFRDYSTPLTGPDRFIPVRSDADRILTCFLEYDADTVRVHDILHERHESVWQQRVGAYQKLRLSTDWVIHALENNGLEVGHEAGLAGMRRSVATRSI